MHLNVQWLLGVKRGLDQHATFGSALPSETGRSTASSVTIGLKRERCLHVANDLCNETAILFDEGQGDA